MGMGIKEGKLSRLLRRERGFRESGPTGKNRPGGGRGREESAKTLSPFKAAGTQAPSPTLEAWQGRGCRMQLRPQKDLLLPGEPDPCPHPRSQFTLPASFTLGKREAKRVTEGACGGMGGSSRK